MPYSNVPKKLWGKMDRCVAKVQRGSGVSKPRAIAICHESVVKGKDIGELIEMTIKDEKRKAKRRERKALKRAKEKTAAGKPLSHEEQTAIAKTTFKEEQKITQDEAAAEVVAAIGGETEKIEVTEDIGDVMEFTREEPASEPDEKAQMVAVDVISPDLPVGGATTFDELDDYREARDEANDIRDVIWDFEMLVDNVLQKSEPGDLGDKIVALGSAMKDRLENPPESKSVLGSLKDRMISGLEKAKLARAKKLDIGTKQKASGIQVFKSKDGFRWFGWVSNKYRDRDWPAEPKLGGQILTEEAHKEFVLWADEDPKERMPRLWPWHTLGGEHKDRADWIDYTDGFLMMSGPLTEKEAELLTGLGKEYDLAMSHGLVRSDHHYDKERGLIQRYRTFEASYLPREFAANEWTDIITIAKEVAEMGFTPEKRTFLERVLGEEKVMELEENTEDRAKELDDLGVEYKGLTEALEQIGSDEEPGPKEEDGDPEFAIPAKEFEGLSDYLETQSKATEANSKAIVAIGDVLVKLSQSDDEKVAAAIRPKISLKDTKPIWQRSASKSDDNVIDEENEEDKDLLESKPGTETHWMEEVLGPSAAEIAPVPK